MQTYRGNLFLFLKSKKIYLLDEKKIYRQTSKIGAQPGGRCDIRLSWITDKYNDLTFSFPVALIFDL